MKYRHRVLALLFLLSIVTYLDRVAIGLASGRIQAELGLSPGQWGWVLGVFALSYAAFEIPSGAMGDRIGPRKVLTRIVIWWSIFTSYTGAVSTFFGLLVSRFLFGAGEAGAYPNSSSSISRWFPTEERGRAHGFVWMASRLGGALAPWLIIPIQIAYGWRMSFYILGVIGVIWAIVWYVWYRDTPAEKPGVTEQERAEIGAVVTRAHHGIDWGVALRSSNLWTIMLMYHFYCWGAFFYLSWLPTYLNKGRGFSERELMVVNTLPFVAGIFGNLFGGWLSDRLTKRYGLKIGRLTVGASGLALSAVCMLGTALTADRIMAVAFLTAGYGFMDCMLPVSWSLCLDVGRKYAGTITGAMNMAGQIGSFLSSTLFGYAVGWFGNDYNKPLIPMSALLLLSAFLYTRIDPERELVPDAAGTPVPEPVTA